MYIIQKYCSVYVTFIWMATLVDFIPKPTFQTVVPAACVASVSVGPFRVKKDERKVVLKF